MKLPISKKSERLLLYRVAWKTYKITDICYYYNYFLLGNQKFVSHRDQEKICIYSYIYLRIQYWIFVRFHKQLYFPSRCLSTSVIRALYHQQCNNPSISFLLFRYYNVPLDFFFYNIFQVIREFKNLDFYSCKMRTLSSYMELAVCFYGRSLECLHFF